MINIKSEISPLKKVMLYAPGEELNCLSENNILEFLFDELIDVTQAKIEHDFFAKVLKENDVEVVYIDELMAETLDLNENIKIDFIKEFVKDTEVINKLNNLSNKELVNICIKGLKKDDKYIVNPIPNLYFQRDPQMMIGNGICISHMSTSARKNESIFSKYIFKYHPDYKDTKIYYDDKNEYNIEGGDILNLSNKVIMIGISERTSYEAINLLAKKLFADSEVEIIIAIEIPKKRASMHLDTIITQVDYDKFVIYANDFEKTKTHIISKHDEIVNSTPLKDTLKTYLNLKTITFINCTDKIEQWNDGVNTLALKPGKVIAYKVNKKTNQLLRDNGIEVIEIDAKQLGMGRGGVHCMSQPLVRL
ncbi:MAG: arginine deiminase family protein [Erysipelotrichaceae bacterium]|nr:arginine deiminase family protein [Erysipelotrichaceae bacterium]